MHGCDMNERRPQLKAIIGLGNPGRKFEKTRHNIGFMVLDEYAKQHNARWQEKPLMHIATISLADKEVFLIKPQTFMNNSGEIVPFLAKQGIKPENMLVVHDELEIPFGQVKLRQGGSARGHNGLKSLIAHCGDNFLRLRCGIGRPVDKLDVPDYVLAPFEESQAAVDQMVSLALKLIDTLL